jgi:primosomal protein N' (replication factor Y)
MRGQSNRDNWISATLQTAILQVLERGEQAMLFLNRRGYAPLTLCRSCGHRWMCPSCTSWLVEHRSSGRLVCHHCGFYQLKPLECSECKEKDSLVACGPGVERIQEQISTLFPEARIAVMTSDTLGTPKQMQEQLALITNRQVDIIIGTQILAKGHHFPFITLVGVVDADLGLAGGDLRACERTYQLLHQVAGRSGREHRAGTVILQTYNPEHPVMKTLAAQDRDTFLKAEALERTARQMPPYGRLVGIIVSGTHLEDVERVAKSLAYHAPRHAEITILGPVPAPLSQLRGRHRWRLLVKAEKAVSIQPILIDWLAKIRVTGNTRIAVDIDPYGFL